ncbi:hypothetical protein D9758_007178 [Tetrapyrgos nigripes]|uniref:RING-type E3 ubiquitin transferase n=1 Tax=Tetrapyrgos nigripes TaxID=182062 RepID=A0A8H5D1L8_9AGAR|nr:hypothetical protein D9758_007178 [Tetrapyrgos nigripes]
MVDRPSTSKPRGICRYYTLPRGCFAGKHCKFLHADPAVDEGPNAKLTPYDQAKSCRYYAQGFCKRGDKCWFLHVPQTSQPEHATEEDELCSICLEKPSIYGLLTGCSHVFCMTCLKQWREPAAKSMDMIYSGVHKKCPMCRVPSKFIVPSSLFFKHDSPRKAEIVEAYKRSMARVPCRYFTRSLAKDKNNPLCPFGKDCFYQHIKEDGTPHVFTDGIEASMRRYRTRSRHDISNEVLNDFFATIRTPYDFFTRLLQDERLDQIQATIQAVRDSLNRVDPGPSRRSDSPWDGFNWRLDGLATPYEDISFEMDVQMFPGLVSLNGNTTFVDDEDDDDLPPLEGLVPPSSPAFNTGAGARREGEDREEEDSASNASMPDLQSVENIDDSDLEMAGLWITDDESDDDEFDHPDVAIADAFASGVLSPRPVVAELEVVALSPPDVSDSPRSSSVEVGTMPSMDSDSGSGGLEALEDIEVIRPPFVTDGRGRVIGASGENGEESSEEPSLCLGRYMEID